MYTAWAIRLDAFSSFSSNESTSLTFDIQGKSKNNDKITTLSRRSDVIEVAMFKQRKKETVKTIVNTRIDDVEKPKMNAEQRLREGVFILAVLFAVFATLSLVTFDPADPSWSQTNWGGSVNNGAGYLGAWVADTLFFTFGLLAYPFPLIVMLAAWAFSRVTQRAQINFVLWGSRLLGLVLLLLTSCGLADINFDDLWYFSSGGVIGDVLSSLALPTFNLLGATLVFLFIWGAGFTFLTGISWIFIAEKIGQFAITGAQHIVAKLRGEPSKVVIEPAEVVTTYSDDDILPVASEAEEDAQREDVSTPNHAVEHVDEKRFMIHMPKANETRSLVEDEVDDHYQSKMSDTIDHLDDEARAKDDYAQQYQEPQITVDDIDIEEDSHSISHIDIEQDDAEIGTPTTSVANDQPISEPSIPQEELHPDEDVAALQKLVSDAKQAEIALQNPFLVKTEKSLPVPNEPLPTLELLYHPEKRDEFIDQDALQEIAKLVEAKLADYKIQAEVVGIYPGPVITRFELDLAPGVKASRISGLSMDLARSLSAAAVRVVEVIPGKPYVGLELPNITRQTVFLSDVVASERFKQSRSPTTVVLGQDIAGEAVVADLSKMPHVLVAGTTGSGKSVGVNVMILSMLYKASPDDVRFIMIDPKMLELSVYEGIPHLLSEVVTDMKDASNALRWCVAEMERRYKLMSVLGVRNIKGFNDKLKMAADAGHPIHDPLWKDGDSMDETPPMLEKLPYIVVVVDEFADLMMVVGKKVEELIARLAQKARAAGIHLILATQRPSVDVITGLIKANIPTRVAFTVSTKTDSRTILDQGGAESLLGMGDMLYLPPGSSHTTRVHGAFASDDDVHAVVNNWKARGKPNYISDIINGDQGPDALLPGEQSETDEDLDPLFDQVVEHVVESRRGSVSGVQRRFKIGYNRAARIVEQMEAQGIVSAPGHNGNREVLAPAPARD